jgi:hypothetical protein
VYVKRLNVWIGEHTPESWAGSSFRAIGLIRSKPLDFGLIESRIAEAPNFIDRIRLREEILGPD